MRRDSWVFDQHLDDSKQWYAGDFECDECGYEFVYVKREDRKVICPKCRITDRVSRLGYDPRLEDDEEWESDE